MASDLWNRLRELANGWAQQVEQKANSASGKPKHIIVSVKVSGSEGGTIGFNADATSLKGDARAYEYGSGVHSTSNKTSQWQQGPRGKILITPKNAPVLAFNWEVLKKYRVGTKFPNSEKIIAIVGPGRGIFNYVEHPGVRAANNGKGYLRPAITDVRKRIRKEVPKAVREEIVGGFRKAFKQG